MLWSGEAILNSCTENLKQDLKIAVEMKDRNGPTLLMGLLKKIYRPSQSKIKQLRDKLESMDIRKYPGENITLFVQDATKLIREIRMNFMHNENVPDLTTAALSGLVTSSDLLVQQLVRNRRIISDVNGFGDKISNQKEDPISVLQDIDELYRVLVNQNDYSPARMPSSGSKALQAQGKLLQDRGASGTGQAKRRCFDCNSDSHLRGDSSCPKVADGTIKPKTSLNIPTGEDKARKPRHGLDDDTNNQLAELIRDRLTSMPPRANIPDEAEHSIKIGEEVVAKYCRHCGRFVKGNMAHYTKEHTGTRSHFNYQGPAAIPAQAPSSSGASGNLANLPGSAPPPAVASLANISPTGIDLSGVPTVDTNTFLCRETTYDFGTMPTIDFNLAKTALLEDDEEGFLQALVKGFGG
jgi:hypothetical protein